MLLYDEENILGGRTLKHYNYIHSSGYAGRVTEVFYRGALIYISFITDAKYHRPVAEGPAVRRFYLNGEVINEEFWVHGVQVIP